MGRAWDGCQTNQSNTMGCGTWVFTLVKGVMLQTAEHAPSNHDDESLVWLLTDYWMLTVPLPTDDWTTYDCWWTITVQWLTSSSSGIVTDEGACLLACYKLAANWCGQQLDLLVELTPLLSHLIVNTQRHLHMIRSSHMSLRGHLRVSPGTTLTSASAASAAISHLCLHHPYPAHCLLKWHLTCCLFWQHFWQCLSSSHNHSYFAIASQGSSQACA